MPGLPTHLVQELNAATVYTWMSQNKLKLNAGKMEVLVLGTPKQRAKISVPSISVNGEIVKILNIPIGNLGSVFDPNMNMAAHVSKAVKSANYHLRNIGRIRKYLTAESTKGGNLKICLLQWTSLWNT